MSALQPANRGAAGFFINLGLVLYPQEQLYQEMTFLSYYLHWSRDEVMALSHQERRRWCAEVSAVNKKLSGNDKSKTFEFR